MNFKEYFLQTDDSKINLWFIENNKNGKYLIIHNNGNAGNMGDRLEKFKFFYDAGFSVVSYDYRGFGKSEGVLSEERLYEDLKAIINFFEKFGYNKEEIILYGESLGGGIATEVASNFKFFALVLESTFTCLNDMAKLYYGLFPYKILLKYKFDNLSKISRVKSLVIVMHSKEDEIVPYEHGVKLYNMANDPKVFIELIGGHNDGGIIISKKAQNEFISTLKRVMDK